MRDKNEQEDAKSQIEYHVRQIEIICDEVGLDPLFWLRDYDAIPPPGSCV